jgi:hypothetical protein
MKEFADVAPLRDPLLRRITAEFRERIICQRTVKAETRFCRWF